MKMELDFFDYVTTSDEPWAFQYGPETKRQSCEWDTEQIRQPEKGKNEQNKSGNHTFDSKGVSTRSLLLKDRQLTLHKTRCAGKAPKTGHHDEKRYFHYLKIPSRQRALPQHTTSSRVYGQTPGASLKS